ncbi:hypothetical protein [Nocardia australiensis]|uniref:hypothetical protein n=1 Tax=Nocardia australiensis TaxID=2887191 RepID=UPI001D14400C|nr:hypothetical protein [Nocardia australiensis]
MLTNTNLLDAHTWASPDVWTSALEIQARRKRRGGGGLFVFIIGGICCLLVVAAIIFGIYKLANRNKD